MALFVVAYDLHEGEDYADLIDALKKLDSCHTQESVWYVNRNCTAAQLRDHLKPHIKDDDYLMVVEFSKRPSWTKAKKGTNAWVDRFFD